MLVVIVASTRRHTNMMCRVFRLCAQLCPTHQVHARSSERNASRTGTHTCVYALACAPSTHAYNTSRTRISAHMHLLRGSSQALYVSRHIPSHRVTHTHTHAFTHARVRASTHARNTSRARTHAHAHLRARVCTHPCA